MKKKLSLSRETLRALSREALRGVHGALDADTSQGGWCKFTRLTNCYTCLNGCTNTCRTVCFSQDAGSDCCLMTELGC